MRADKPSSKTNEGWSAISSSIRKSSLPSDSDKELEAFVGEPGLVGEPFSFISFDSDELYWFLFLITSVSEQLILSIGEIKVSSSSKVPEKEVLSYKYNFVIKSRVQDIYQHSKITEFLFYILNIGCVSNSFIRR